MAAIDLLVPEASTADFRQRSYYVYIPHNVARGLFPKGAYDYQTLLKHQALLLEGPAWKTCTLWAWWCTSSVSALRRLKQEDWCAFEISLDYTEFRDSLRYKWEHSSKKKKRHEHKQVILYMYTAMIRPSSVMAVQENETKQAGYTIMTLYQTLLIFTCP